MARYNHLIQNMIRDITTKMVDGMLPNADELEDMIIDASWEAAEEAKDFWSAEAGRVLNTTRERYQRQIGTYQSFEDADAGIVVMLNTDNDKLVKAIEDGAPKYSLKPGFLQNRQTRVIPMKVASPPFRTVSAKAQATPWEHPGFIGLKLAEIVDDELDQTILPKHATRIFKKL